MVRRMPRLSVVVPVYNVEDFLAPCLDSIAAQTFGDLEVVLVNDGSTDSSPAIAEAYTRRDERFKLVHRPNGGLSAARNTGIEHATGDYLAFVDSDDLLPADAYELLVGSLERTGSDFATGKVLRLMSTGTRTARFLAGVFRETRLKTHITKYRPLLSDRSAWNKVFRRSFWDEHGLRFPEGRINEDIPVILPLHFSARSVDVIAEPVYYWRSRDTGELSITERRAEVQALQTRLWAVTDVHDWLATHGFHKATHWYDETIVADDLRSYLNALDRGDDEYRELFLEKVNALLDSADDDIYDGLTALERLKWHLVRRRLMPELLEVLRFQREEMAERAPVRIGRHWYGDYPFRSDERLAIPQSVYRLGGELGGVAHIDGFALEDGRLRLRGWAFIEGIGAAERGAQRVTVSLLRPGRLRRVRHRLAAIRLETVSVHRPDANASSGQRVCDVSWSGFEATLDPERLRRAGRWRPGSWELYVTVEAGGLRRRLRSFGFDRVRRPRAVELPAPPELMVRAGPRERRELGVTVAGAWAAVRSHRLDDGELVLAGDLRGWEPQKLELREADRQDRLRYALETDGTSFTARLPLDEPISALHPRTTSEEDEDADADDDDEPPVDPSWELFLTGGGRRVRVALPADAPRDAARWRSGGHEVALSRTEDGHASLIVRAPRARLTAAAWEPGGALRVAGEGLPAGGAAELVLVARDRHLRHAFGLRTSADGGFEAVVTPAAVRSLDGSHPLPEGKFGLHVQAADLVALTPSAELAARLPLSTVAGHKRLTLAELRDGDVVLAVGSDLEEDERGDFNQRRLRRTVYAPRRADPLVDSVVYSSFGGLQCSDSPRAIHDELVRRGAALEHVWVVADGACRPPDGARAVRESSREHHEVLARSRYVVANDHLPEWFERREDQICLQTWHGTPLKKLGFDVSSLRGNRRRLAQRWSGSVRNWQYVVSPSGYATPILRRAFELESEMLETGYPRNDLLAGAGRDARARRLRERLGLPDGVPTALYAPTFRDHVIDRRGRYRLDLRLDLERVAEALGEDAVVLFRRHPYVLDDLPAGAGGRVRDVSSYPDGTELLLAADVLITDYSSLLVDFANTGRPILLFAYDVEDYRDEIRGLYVDLEDTAPAPLLATSGEVAEALREIDAVRARYAGRYEAFAQRFCELDDGGATARVVDAVFRS